MSVLETLVSQAVVMGLDTLEVRYKDRHEEVFGLRGGVGVGIARFPSDSAEAQSLRRELYSIAAKKRRRLILASGELDLRVRVFDSFGEDAFRVAVRRARLPRAGF